ncbi:MAG: CRTAC1 family protein [Verrucomicrobiae bacterium]|nr:CRTAC1 family protein [Verrucomicrobiae bacterium]
MSGVGLCLVAFTVACERNPDIDTSAGREQGERAVSVEQAGKDQAGHERMVQTLAEVHKHLGVSNQYFGSGPLRKLTADLAKVDRVKETGRYVRGLIDLGRANIDYGNLQDGLKQLKAAYNILIKAKAPPQLTREGAYQLGIANLRLAESENCCASFSPESCILPLQGAAIHTRRAGSEAAVRYFAECIDLSADFEKARMRAQWLLNVAYMTLGDYPDNVPESVRLPASILGSDADFPRFENISESLGLATDSLAGGVALDDFDGDGDFDIVVSCWDTGAAMHYFENRLEEGFVDRSEPAGLSGMLGGLNLIHADYDNDGDLDIFVTRGAWFGRAGNIPNSLLRNDGKGTFIDVTYAAGLADVNFPTQTAVWLDFDNDGSLDLYVGNEATGDNPAPSQLFRNQGDGTFVDVAPAAGVTNDKFAKAVACGDLDNDGWTDIVVSNLYSENRLYHNNGDGTFIDIATQAGVDRPLKSFPAWIWDYDNDGNLDIFIASYSGAPEDYVRKALQMPYTSETCGHYHNDGAGAFSDLAEDQGFAMPLLVMGANFGDLNNDGFLDAYFGTGAPELDNLMPNALYLNQAGRNFADVTMASGMGHLQKGHGIAFVDLDGDGDQDVFEQMGGAKKVDRFRDAVYDNPGFGNHWVDIHLAGTSSNRCAIGTRIRIDFRESGVLRSVYRKVDTGGSFGSQPLQQHIGIGSATAIETVEVFWPKTGETQVFHHLPAGCVLAITEGSETVVERQVRKVAK